MKIRILLSVLYISCLTGCATFRDQVEESQPHAKIIIVGPERDEHEMRDEQVAGTRTVTWVDRIDSVSVPRRTRIEQVYRILPGEHEIKNEVVTVEIKEIDGTLIMGKIYESGLIEETQVRFISTISKSRTVTNAMFEAGNSYILENSSVRKLKAQAKSADLPSIPSLIDHASSKNTKDAALQAPSILGDWTVDVDATMRANALFADELRDSIKKGLEYNPFDLSITNGMYVSKGKGTMEVMTDKYEVMSVEGDTVTIKLTPAVPTRKKRIGDGTITLSVRKGGLMIPGPGGVSIVMKRPAKDQSNSKQSSTDKKEP